MPTARKNDIPILDMAGISYRRNGSRILRDVSWQIAPGEHWAVIGPNGAGKTTLLKIATGYDWPTDGRVSAIGRSFGEVDLRELRRHIGWVSSAIAAIIQPDQSVREVVLTGPFASTALYDRPAAAVRRRADRLLSALGCRSLTRRSWSVLSAGERQRVLIARALLSDPKLLILDEPCAGLDIPAREQLLETIDALGRSPRPPTMIFVTHHIEEIPPAFTHALALKAGRVLAAGPKRTVLTSRALSDLYDLRITVAHHHGRYWPRIRGGSTG